MYKRYKKIDECHFNDYFVDKTRLERALLPLIQIFFYGKESI
jgi:hypothetical protein